MQLNEYGMIAHQQWEKLGERFPHIEGKVFQIMPNHMHGIIHVGASAPVAPDTTAGADNRAGASPARTVGNIIGAYKSLVAHECLKIHQQKWSAGAGLAPAPDVPAMGKIWQRNYYEHIIRNEKSYHTIRDYIINNPAQWQADRLNPIHKQNTSA